MRTSRPVITFSQKDRSSRATPKAGHLRSALVLLLRSSIRRRRRCARTSEKPTHPNPQSRPHCFGGDSSTKRSPPFSMPLFAQVRRRRILRTSPFGDSRKFGAFLVL